jgi:hypothetical protein
MAQFAKETTVSASDTQKEIERTLRRYGATSFGYGWDETTAVIAFKIKERQIKLFLPLPNKKDFLLTPSRGTRRSDTSAQTAWEQATRQSWRALALIIKAKLEAAEAGITTVEREFLPDVVLPNGQTVGQAIKPQIEQMYLTGEMPPLLLTTGE